jgi:hypothetical protein
VFENASTGACPSGHTFDPGSLVCVEACQTDVECQLTLERTSAGELVSVLDASRGTCSPTTGRCVRGMGTEGVGRMCTGTEDCSVDVGVCWAGGTCAEFACASASDTSPSGICDGGRGICLGRAPDRATVCVEGCVTSTDCNPGNACIPFHDAMGMPLIVGGFAGSCQGLCSADDDCSLGQHCDLLAAPGNEGLCVEGCTSDAGCEGGAACDIARGVCRTPCPLGTECVVASEACLDGLCEQLTLP